MATLAEAVQTLPSELFNEVYDYTFTAPSDLSVKIDVNYKPPALLQVSRSTREQFAKSYFGGSTIFYGVLMDAWHWADNLTLDHMNLINEIRVIGPQCLAAGMLRHELARWIRRNYQDHPWPWYIPGFHSVKYKVVFVEANGDQLDEYRWMSYTESVSELSHSDYLTALSWHQMRKARGE